MSSPSPGVRQYCEERGFSQNVREGGLEYLLRGWEHIVAEIEGGYQALLDEYLNDMDGRHIISELLPIATAEEKAKAEGTMPSLDDRFP